MHACLPNYNCMHFIVCVHLKSFMLKWWLHSNAQSASVFGRMRRVDATVGETNVCELACDPPIRLCDLSQINTCIV